jgi:hypothetical protein
MEVAGLLPWLVNVGVLEKEESKIKRMTKNMPWKVFTTTVYNNFEHHTGLF